MGNKVKKKESVYGNIEELAKNYLELRSEYGELISKLKKAKDLIVSAFLEIGIDEYITPDGWRIKLVHKIRPGFDVGIFKKILKDVRKCEDVEEVKRLLPKGLVDSIARATPYDSITVSFVGVQKKKKIKKVK